MTEMMQKIVLQYIILNSSMCTMEPSPSNMRLQCFLQVFPFLNVPVSIHLLCIQFMVFFSVFLQIVCDGYY